MWKKDGRWWKQFTIRQRGTQDCLYTEDKRGTGNRVNETQEKLTDTLRWDLKT